MDPRSREPLNEITHETCVDGGARVRAGSPLAFSVRVGSLYHSRGGEKRLVDSAMKHPLYDPESNDFDVAVLLLAPPALAFSRDVQPAQLASADSDARANELGTSTPSNTLMKVNLPILSRKECEGAYGAAITARMLCAGYLDGSHDACQGDSGGPLAVGGKVVGVVSWGYGCAQEGCPGVYTSISSVRQWIREVTDGV
ncbi:Trypsin alpha-3 [Gryllus bimaculatus]|nr:Trypsin alpha-3 [Gryllus bimaculatus]